MKIECAVLDFHGSSGASSIGRSIRIARADLGLERITVVYPGTKRYPLAEGVEAVPVDALAEPGALFTAPRT